MKILEVKISAADLRNMSQRIFGNLVKAVVDIENELLALDAELHSDLESLLLERGSKQEHIWGINIYPDLHGNDMVEFDSMINLRPSQGNKTREVDNPATQQKIKEIVNKWLQL